MSSLLFFNNSSLTLPPIPEAPLAMPLEQRGKASDPIIQSASPEGTIGSAIQSPVYSDEQNETWEILLKKHGEFLNSDRYFCQEYKEGYAKINLAQNRVSFLHEASDALQKATGWQLIRVEGLVAPEKFFKLLANKIFPCTDYIRHRDEIEYTFAPDTVHDQIGHLPMLTHRRFADFFQLFGLVGTKIQTPEQLEWLTRIYWFTVEFGLINSTLNTVQYNPLAAQIYGAGIASSCGEIVYSLSSQPLKLPLNFDVMTKTSYDIHSMQNILFEISSFDELENKFREWVSHNFLVL